MLERLPAQGEEKNRGTQLLLGETVKVTEMRDGWAGSLALEQGYYISRADTPGWKGYPGWVSLAQLTEDDDYGYDYCVKAASTTAAVSHGADFVRQPFYMGTRLLALGKTADGRIKVLLPGGRPGYVEEKDLLYHKNIPEGEKLRDSLLDTALLFLNTPYEWGGRTVAGIDCSGLVNIVFRVHGIDVPRNADDQYLAARSIKGKDLRKGDLVFLADQAKKDRITHVMIYDGEGQLMEAAMEPGKAWRISCLERLGKEPRDISNGELINGNKVYFASFITD